MKIVALSDLHGYLPPTLPEGDVLCIAGDICPDWNRLIGNATNEEGAYRWMHEEFYPWILRQPTYKRIIACWGNHDWVGQNRMGGNCILSNGDGPAVEFYDCRHIDVEGTQWWISPWSDKFYDWAFMKTPEELAKVYTEIPLFTDVIVSHQPPKDPSFSGLMSKVGSKALMENIKRVEPQVVICGHIHEGYGQYTFDHESGNPGRIYNVSIVDGNYVPYDKRITEIEL